MKKRHLLYSGPGEPVPIEFEESTDDASLVYQECPISLAARSIPAMPYLQLDVNGRHAPEDKKRLAKKMSETYSSMMAVDMSRISIAIRELGEGAVWRTVDGEPEPASVLMCDIRRGRPAELRMEVAKALCDDCIAILGLREDRLNVEFTQHAGDEMYHPSFGGFSPEWSEGEA